MAISLVSLFYSCSILSLTDTISRNGIKKYGPNVEEIHRVCILSHVGLSVTSWAVAHPAPFSMGFPRQEYWSGLSFPTPGDLPDAGIKPVSPALAGGFFTTEPPGKPQKKHTQLIVSFVL